MQNHNFYVPLLRCVTFSMVVVATLFLLNLPLIALGQAPTITSTNPSTIPTGEFNRVTVNGTNFISGTVILEHALAAREVGVAGVAPLDAATGDEPHADHARDVIAERRVRQVEQRVGERIEIVGRRVGGQIGRERDVGRRAVVVLAPRDRRR